MWVTHSLTHGISWTMRSWVWWRPISNTGAGPTFHPPLTHTQHKQTATALLLPSLRGRGGGGGGDSVSKSVPERSRHRSSCKQIFKDDICFYNLNVKDCCGVFWNLGRRSQSSKTWSFQKHACFIMEMNILYREDSISRASERKWKLSRFELFFGKEQKRTFFCLMLSVALPFFGFWLTMFPFRGTFI